MKKHFYKKSKNEAKKNVNKIKVFEFYENDIENFKR